MPRYDIRCRACGTTFEVTRPMAQADQPARCPHGHDDTVRLLPAVAVMGKASGVTAPRTAGAGGGSGGGSGGGCCGGGCCG